MKKARTWKLPPGMRPISHGEILFHPSGAYTSASGGRTGRHAAGCCRTVQWGVLSVKGNMEERAQELALYIIENRATVRAAASRFGISKSTVHKDLSERLPAINRGLYQQVKEVLNENKAERHIRGGIATRKKYKWE